MKEASRIGFATTQVCCLVSHIMWYQDCGDLGMEIPIYVIYLYICKHEEAYLLFLLS